MSLFPLVSNTLTNPLQTDINANSHSLSYVSDLYFVSSIGGITGLSTINGQAYSTGLTNPLTNDLDAGGYNINNVNNITCTSINSFPAFPTASIFTSTDPIQDLAVYSSASYFVMSPTYTDTTLTFQNAGKNTPIDKSFYNIQNNTTNVITIQFKSGGITSAIGTIAPAIIGVGFVMPAVGVLALEASTYTFY